MIAGLVFLAVSISCKSFMPAKSTGTGNVPVIDFTTPGMPLNVKVQLDKKQTASGKISPAGGSVSLTSADGSKFTLNVPADALEADTMITMTAVKTIEGAPLDNTTPTAVQLEPSGLFFKEMATLTIVPAKEIPIKEQIIFGYEGDGQDYHLALVDPKSKEIKVKLMRFSGAGVGSGSASAAAANIMMQASTSETRLRQILGEYLQNRRQKAILEGELDPEMGETIESAMDQYEDQVIRKKIVAAGLDCKHARPAMQDILSMGRQRQLLGLEPDPDMWEKIDKLAKIAEKCPGPYQIVGGLDDWQTNTRVCDIMKPFTLTGILTMNFSGGLSGTYDYSGGPFNAHGTGTYTISLSNGVGSPGTMTGGGEGSAGGRTGSGTEKYTLTPIEPCS